MDQEGKTFFTDDQELIAYRSRGAFTPEYGSEKTAFTLQSKDDNFEINTSYNNNAIIRKHHIPEFFEVTHYNAQSDGAKQMLVHHNHVGTNGWIKEFLRGGSTPYVSMVGQSGIVLLTRNHGAYRTFAQRGHTL